MGPIRGQIGRVRNPGLERFLLDEGNPEGVTYIVPRTDDCILGDTAEEGEWDTEPDPISRRVSCGAVWPLNRGSPRLRSWNTGLGFGRAVLRLGWSARILAMVRGASITMDTGVPG